MVYIDISASARFLFWDSLQTIHETVSHKTKLKQLPNSNQKLSTLLLTDHSILISMDIYYNFSHP